MQIQNPILKGFNPDPSFCRVGEDYYIATSTFEWFPGVQIHHSKDLVNWRLAARPLNRISLLDMKGNPNSGGVWAPSLTYQDGLFWLVYSDIKVHDGKWKDGHNYLTTCETIDGEWSDPIHLNSSGFDPALFHDPNGKKYVVNLLWDHRVYTYSFGGIVLQEYCHEARKLVGEARVIFQGSELRLTEGPNLYWIDGYYYLLTAEGGTEFNHAATLARSQHIDGPYELHPANPLLTAWDSPGHALQKCGHASIVHTHTGEWYLAHLAARPLIKAGKPLLDYRGFCPLGRETALQKLEWVGGWPYVVGGRQGSVEVEGPNMPEHRWEPEGEERDHFDQPTLGPHYQSLRIPLNDTMMSLTERLGHLRLYGKESLTSVFTQSLVARRWQSFNFDAAVALSCKPYTFQQAAGLVCYYNTENWTSVQVTWNERKGRIIDVVGCDNFSFSQPIEGKEIKVPDTVEYIHLKVEVREHQYTFYYSFDGDVWIAIPAVFESRKLSDDYVRKNGFTGAFVGMHCQDTSGGSLPADFDYFDYRELVIR